MNRKRHKVWLEVRSIEDIREVYKDTVRIPASDRGELKPGRIHKFITSKGAAYFILRGSTPVNNGKILMDEASRNKLNLEPGAKCEFDIREVGFLGELSWAYHAVDPTYRVAAKLGVLSFALGILSLLLSLLPFLQTGWRWILAVLRCFFPG